MKPTLLILAAGMGSRFGGLKQVEPVGPNGEAIIDYSIYDAIKAGFGKVVFVIRKSFADAFKEKFDKKLAGKIKVEYVFQEMNSEIDANVPWYEQTSTIYILDESGEIIDKIENL